MSEPCASHKADGFFNDPCCPHCPEPRRDDAVALRETVHDLILTGLYGPCDTITDARDAAIFATADAILKALSLPMGEGFVHSPSAHTQPGAEGIVLADYAPWSAEWVEEHSDWCVMGAEQMDWEGGSYTPSICTLSDWVSGKEASLIAAAPDLLDALDELLCLINQPDAPETHELFQSSAKGQAAVIKATTASSPGTPEGVKPISNPMGEGTP